MDKELSEKGSINCFTMKQFLNFFESETGCPAKKNKFTLKKVQFLEVSKKLLLS